MLLATIPCNAITWQDGAMFAVGIGYSSLLSKQCTFKSNLGGIAISAISLELLRKKDLEARKQLALLQQQQAGPDTIKKTEQELKWKESPDLFKKIGVWMCGVTIHLVCDVIKTSSTP